MRRVIALLGFLLVAGLVIPVLASAQETADHQAIRALLDREQAGWESGDAEQIDACYAEGYTQVDIPRGNGKPQFVLATLNTQWKDENRKEWVLASDFLGLKEALADTVLAMQRTYKMSHIDIDGDDAVAIATFSGAWNDTVRGERVEVGWQSLWMLRKIDGDWKYATGIGGISSFRESTPVP